MRLLGALPDKLTVAVSGGVDSMAVLHFLTRVPSRDVTVAFFHHDTPTSDVAFTFITSFCESKRLPLVVGYLTGDRPAGLSKEEHWRNKRYEFLHALPGPVVTAHHLDDCVETWLWGAMHGTPKTVNYAYGNAIRPFLLVKKEELRNYAIRHGVPWVEDETNNDTAYTRNFIRKEIVPKALTVNPGLYRVVARKVVERNQNGTLAQLVSAVAS